MKVSLIQMNSQENKAANLAQAKRLIDEAVAADRPDLILLPEMFTHLSESREAKKAAAENLPGGEAWTLLRDLAAQKVGSVGMKNILSLAYIETTPTSVEDDNSNNIPTEYVLYQNYPNPFNPITKIKYTVPNVIANEVKQSHLVTLKVYDVTWETKWLHLSMKIFLQENMRLTFDQNPVSSIQHLAYFSIVLSQDHLFKLRRWFS